MAGKTNSDAIRDLELEVAKFTERFDYNRRDLARLDALITKVADDFDGFRVRIAILESKQSESRIVRDERDRRR